MNIDRAELLKLITARARRIALKLSLLLLDKSERADINDRYDNGIGAQVAIFSRSYISFRDRHDDRLYRSSLASPRSLLRLYLADIAKYQGRFPLAWRLYTKLLRRKGVSYDAHCGLADMYLISASWNEAYQIYRSRGLILDVQSKFSVSSSWQDAKYEDTINLLTGVWKQRKHDDRAIWFLMAANRGAGNTVEALRFASLLEVCHKHSQSEINHLYSNLTFRIDQNKAIAALNTQFNGWKDELERRWSAKVVSKITVQEAGAKARCDRRPFNGELSFKISATCFYEGKKETVESQYDFQETFVTKYDEADIVPLNGTIIADDKFLVVDSSHHPLVDLEVFTPSVRSQNLECALIVTPEPDIVGIDRCVYIGCNANYYHWLLEDLPRLSALNDEELSLPILVDSNIAPWQVDLLERCGISQKQFKHVNFGHPLRCKNLIAPPLLSRDNAIHPSAVKFMRAKLQIDESVESIQGKRFYLTRKAVAGRSMLNADQITKLFSQHGFEVLDPSALSIQQQIDLFRNAEVIAGPAGAALTNLLFAPRSCRLVQLGAVDIPGLSFISLATAIGQSSFVCYAKSLARPHTKWIWTNFDFAIDPSDARMALDAALT